MSPAKRPSADYILNRIADAKIEIEEILADDEAEGAGVLTEPEKTELRDTLAALARIGERLTGPDAAAE